MTRHFSTILKRFKSRIFYKIRYRAPTKVSVQDYLIYNKRIFDYFNLICAKMYIH